MLVECTNKYHKHKRNHTINKRARKRKLEKTNLSSWSISYLAKNSTATEVVIWVRV